MFTLLLQNSLLYHWGHRGHRGSVDKTIYAVLNLMIRVRVRVKLNPMTKLQYGYINNVMSYIPVLNHSNHTLAAVAKQQLIINAAK